MPEIEDEMSDSVLHSRRLEESADWQQRAEAAEKALAEANEALLECINQRGELQVQRACLRHDLRGATAKLAEATATPDKPHWWALVAASAHVPDGARLILNITTDYNRMRAALAEAAEDTADLDWCLLRGTLPVLEGLAWVVRVGGSYGELIEIGRGDTPRAAIRAARGK